MRQLLEHIAPAFPAWTEMTTFGGRKNAVLGAPNQQPAHFLGDGERQIRVHSPVAVGILAQPRAKAPSISRIPRAARPPGTRPCRAAGWAHRSVYVLSLGGTRRPWTGAETEGPTPPAAVRTQCPVVWASAAGLGGIHRLYA